MEPATDSPVIPVTPIAATEAELAGVNYNADGLVAAIVQEVGTNEVLMLGWMNDVRAAAHARHRAHVVLEPEPPGVLVQGRDVGRPAIRA